MMNSEGMDAGDIISAIALVAAAVGVWFNYMQLVANHKYKVAEFVIALTNSFASNDEISRMYYKIEYGEFEYNDAFHDSPDEKPLDNLIVHFENFAQLYLLSNFDLENLKNFAYRYLVVYQNSEVQRYFAFLDNWYKSRGMKMRPFDAFRKVGEIIERNHYSAAAISDSKNQG